MKRVPVLDEEPEELSAWRAKRPRNDAAQGAESRQVWKRFKRSGPYHAVVGRLLARQQGLCGYCEQRLSRADGSLVLNDYQVEHVLAKSGGMGRVLDWRNLMLCCGGGTRADHGDSTRSSRSTHGKADVSCGQAKGHRDLDASCDPRALPWQEPVVRVDIDGRLRANDDACRRHGIEPERLSTAIATLALNCERLRVARESAIDNLSRLLVEMLASSELPTQARARTRPLVEGRLCPDDNGHLRRFWTTERLYLGEDAEAWIRANAALLCFD